jgi:uncharacterized OB-fold protein
MIRSAPRNGREATPHWRAAREGRLVMPFCAGCGRLDWPPADQCPRCGGALIWRDCSGHGTIVTFSIVRRPVQPEWKDEVPYVVAFVALDEGPRLLSNIVDCDPETVAIGQRVTCAFVETTDPELGLPVFRPAPP